MRPVLPSSPDIVFALAGDLHRNSRALRQLSALSDAQLTVQVLSLPGEGLSSVLPAGVEHRVVDSEPGTGPRFFARLHRAFSEALRETGARLFHASDLYVLHPVKQAARRTGAPFSYDARELYAHVSATVGRPHVRAFWTMVERRGVAGTAGVWTVSDSIADHLAKHRGIVRPFVQLNAPAFVEPTSNSFLRDQTGLEDNVPVLLHLGQLRKDRGADRLIDAMAAWPDWHRSISPRLVFLGYGPERARLSERVGRQNLAERIRFLDPVPPAELPGVVAGATAGVTLLEPTCLNHRYALPNKLFDYMQAGLPVVASDLVECTRIVRGYGCGLTVDPEDTGALVAALSRSCADSDESRGWGRNARAAAETLDWKRASQAFIRQVNDIIAPPSP